MRSGVLQSGICWLLSALLTANNGLPLVLEHAHPVGRNLQHDHHRSAAMATAFAAKDLERAEAVQCHSAMFGVTPHIHLVWFGFEFTLRPPIDPDSDQDETPSADVSLVRFADTRLLDSSPAGTLPPARYEGVSERQEPIKPASPAARHLAALPLCDTARHERSGVQLI